MGHIFSLNHFAMEIKDKKDPKSHSPGPADIAILTNYDLILHQLKTTRNIYGSKIVNWFTGHLNFQIEHHIWPMMPRHNLPKVQPIFQEFCEKHNIEYQQIGFFDAFVDVFNTLQNVQHDKKYN